ncbi:GTP-binding protein [Hydrogenovibrio sp. SC-1]|uniref:LeoA/HP0731 family dynamin-like GTPase n=1 Tax=Hydrogenovibrio sp. SC-1 TaxID=2065820 RepID=UPI000C7CDFA4|nr:LeoA/HP0731 family dynamin-like GTPase [Hydrogenovibrio sp. SC-1]PLA73482.1 GTP-binding protein [Hydrogenovibrio sp. SC-1]
MNQFKKFNVDKESVLNSLKQMEDVIEQMAEVGIDATNDLEKLKRAVTSVEDEVLRVALLGAFSDGKTSVIASWLGKIMDDMKIDSDESSDQLSIYKPEGLNGQCEIVDTPGLFGDKEKNDSGKEVMYEDITKRYISEAHLIFYVVDATNPLKESHGDIVRWILRDLNKLSSTIFIINKMDEVADLTDEVSYAEQAHIKKENLVGKLKRVASLSEAELSELKVVCMASNPNGRGLDFWFKKPEIYEDRSRINDLRTVTNAVLDNTVPSVLVAKTGLDVVKQIVTEKVTLAQVQVDALQKNESQTIQEINRIDEDIRSGKKQIRQMRDQLYNELNEVERRLLVQLRSASIEDIMPFLEDEIGYSNKDFGFKLQFQIKSSIERFFDDAKVVSSRIGKDIEIQLDARESLVSSISQNASKAVSGVASTLSKMPVDTIKTGIFAARDALGKVAGVVYKFKPWEASKLAGSISKWAGPAGAAVTIASDLFSAYQVNEQEEKLKNLKSDLTEMIKEVFKDVYDLLIDDEKMFEFFAPQIHEYQIILEALENDIENIRSTQVRLVELNQKLESIALFDRDSDSH